MMKHKILILLILLSYPLLAQEALTDSYWKVTNRKSIVWNLTNEHSLPHSDNIEMAGNKVASIIYYTIDENRNLQLERDVIYPQLRTYPQTGDSPWKVYRAYFRHTYGHEIHPNIYHRSNISVFNRVDSVEIAGKLIFYHTPIQEILLTRTIMPSMTGRLLVEKWELTNLSGESQKLTIGNTTYKSTTTGYKGEYHLNAYSDAKNEVTILPGDQYSFAIYFAAGIDEEALNDFDLNLVELQRNDFLTKMQENLILKTPSEELNMLFYFSKIRAAENIFTSKMGKVHSPGGGNYYVGVWANDQAEYSGPFFPFLGYDDGNEAALNAYRVFLKNIPENYQPISSSFEIEGELTCCGSDRGDAAMIAYGASQFALLTGDKKIALELWPLIEWCLEYSHRKINENGVVMSTTDEMEGRISTGDANLATSSLYYGGLKFASYLADDLGFKKESRTYSSRQKEMARAIEAHFGYTIEGMETYRYFEGNTHLRHWICLPLVMGIDNRAKNTTRALLDKLWTENGVLVELIDESEESNVFWDRGTLYALRGTFKAGTIDKSLEKLLAFSGKRLLGDHVPYVIEAYPENNMRHLSAESALYCRIFIEGLLGFEQTGFRSFQITPRLPEEFDMLSLSKMHVADTEISIDIKRSGNNLHLIVSKLDTPIIDKMVSPAEVITVKF